MARGDQLGRQWKIIQTLIASKHGRLVTELAKHLGCHRRTVYRDLEALQQAGFPVYSDKQAGHTRWAIMHAAKHQVPVPFDLTELMALYFSRDMLKVLRGTVFHDALASLFEKIQSTLAPAYLRYLEKFKASVRVGERPFKSYEGYADILAQVNQAVVERRRVEMVYYAMHRRRTTRRRVAPYRLWFSDGTFYLIGHCDLRKSVRTFALDRIQSLALTDQGFQMPEGFDMEDFLGASFGVFQGQPVKVCIQFSSEVAGYIQEKTWHHSQRITPADDGSILFTAQVAGLDDIRFWVMKWGVHAQVMEPAALRRMIKDEAVKLVKAYS